MRPIVSLLSGVSLLLALTASATAENLKPFMAAPSVTAGVATVASEVKGKLEASGLSVVGTHQPFGDDRAVILGVTSPALKKAAAKSPMGGFAAVARVAITRNGDATEVSYTLPSYLAIAAGLGAQPETDAKLASALGGQTAFGSENGLPAEDLPRYRYMALMPRFKDATEIASFDGHAQAVAAIESGLAKVDSDATLAWKVEVNPEQTLFGIAMTGGAWKGQLPEIMQKIDTGTPRATAALPFEILVSGKTAYFLPLKYRLAVMFPDLSMGTFMRISDVPGMMEESMTELATLAGG